MKLSQENNVDFQFEASVAGGIPVIRPMYSSLNSNRIERIIGIMNGTTNYILTNMTERGLSYEEALKEAQDKGYAEADPTNDVSGYDAARKIAILATLGFHSAVTFRDVAVEGIEKITHEDIAHATEMGYAVKLLAIAQQNDDGISLNVHPAFIPRSHPWQMSEVPIMRCMCGATVSEMSCFTDRAPAHSRQRVLLSAMS